MRNIIIDFQNSDTWKIQLTNAINFFFSASFEEECKMHSSSSNIEFASYNDADEVAGNLENADAGNLEISMRGSDIIFDSVQLMYYKCHKVNFSRGGSYIDSPDWIKKKKATINSENTDDKCFQYAATIALSYEEIKWNPERVSHIKPFINKHNGKGVNYS